MISPVSIRLDPAVRDTLENEAKRLGVGLSTYLRELAAAAARDVRWAEILAGSAAVARHVAGNAEARSFMNDWGTPDTEAP